uniref:Sema domain-containing protein n=1 Tax=Panagrellus redivivus TaxID=6233 RepID=A0A7E4W7D0_PANRE
MTRCNWFIVLLFLFFKGIGTSFGCSVSNVRKIFADNALGSRTSPNFIIYGLTQDCQLFFARLDQLDQLRHLRVQTKVTYCLPNLIQLHWRQYHHHGPDGSQFGLQLLFKRASNQICTLPLEFPSKNALSGFSIFTYSILSSLNYASCSYIANSSFVMEPDLSFMDTSYSDVIYFADPSSSGSYWNVRQFKFDKYGYFKALESFIVKNIAEGSSRHIVNARDYMASLDNQRHRLYFAQRQSKHLAMTCAYDLLFRPSKAVVRSLLPFKHDSSHFHVNSLSVEGEHVLIGESHRRTQDDFSTRLFLSERSKNGTSTCLLELSYLVEFGLMSLETKIDMEKVHLPRFGFHHKVKPDPTKVHREQSLTTTKRPTSASVHNVKVKPSTMTTKEADEEFTTKLPPSTDESSTVTAQRLTTVSSKEEEDIDVGDGRLLKSDEKPDVEKEEQNDDDANTDGDHLGLMTAMTVNEGSGFDQVTSSTEVNASNFDSNDTDIAFANGTIPENLAASGQSNSIFIPVILSVASVYLINL